jgi:large subunit ribosomal protein L13
MIKISKTYIPKAGQVERKCYLIDAGDKILGRVAAKAAALLRGKHKVTFTPNLDSGDLVVIVNAGKIRVTGRKLKQKIYARYSGYPSGLRQVTLEDLMTKAPTEAMRLAVSRMIPKGALGNLTRTRLRVYAGDQHPHQAQNPVSVAV